MRTGNGAKSAADRLKELADRKAAIDQRIQRIERQLAAKARKEDTRLKILVGAAMLADAATHPETSEMLRLVLARAITREMDRQFLQARGLHQVRRTNLGDESHDHRKANR